MPTETRFGPIVLGKRTKFDSIRSRLFPIGPDFDHHGIGAMTHVGGGWSIQHRAPNDINGRPGYRVPSHAINEINQRRALRAGDPITVGSLTVYVDLQEGNNASHPLEGGWDVTVACTVHGLDSNSYTSVPATAHMASDAEAAVVSVLGERGSAGPTLRGSYFNTSTGAAAATTVPTFLSDYHIEMRSSDYASVHVQYKGYKRFTFAMSGANGSVESNKDVSGGTVKVSYQYPADYGFTTGSSGGEMTGDQSLAGVWDTTSALFPKPVFEATVAIGFQLLPGTTIGGTTYTLAIQAAAKLKSLQGSMNNATWSPTDVSGSGDSLSFGAHDWLLEQVDAHSDDGTYTFWVDTVYHLRATSWDQTATYVSRDTGLPPPDLTSDGQKTVQVNPAITFGSSSYAGN